MIKDWCARVAHWNSKRHLWLSHLWADVAEWLSTHFRWRSIRARRQPPIPPQPLPRMRLGKTDGWMG